MAYVKSLHIVIIALLIGVSAFSQDKENAIYTSHYENGQLFEKYEGYLDENSEIVRHGEYWSYHPNGQLYVHAFYKQGTPDGMYESWFSNGNKENEYQLKEGLFHGAFKMWYEDGTIHTIGGYMNNERKGAWKAYNEKGELISEAHFE